MLTHTLLLGHPGNEIIKLLKLIKSICYTKQIKHRGSFREKSRANFPPGHPVRPLSTTISFQTCGSKSHVTEVKRGLVDTVGKEEGGRN